MNKIVTAIGSSCIDEYYSVDKFPLMGEKVNGLVLNQVVGGMIGNAAAVLSGYGIQTYMIDYLSESRESQMLVDDLVQYNISTAGLQISPEYVNNRCLVFLTDTGERSIIILNSKNKPFELSDKQEEILQKSDYIYTTLADIKRFANREQLFKNLFKNNGKLVLDIEEPSIKGKDDLELISLATIVFINDKAQEVLDQLFTFDVIKDRVPLVVVTLGEKGSVAYSGKKEVVFDPIAVDVVDTTGAGDTYNASFLYGITQGWSIEESGNFASVAASEKIKKIGPRSGVRPAQEILDLMSKK